MSVALANHRRSCKARVEQNVPRMNSSSTSERVVNDSGPVLDELIESQEVSELRDQIQKLIRQNEQLKDSKANKLLAKSKSRQAKLESKVKTLKTEKKELLEKYVKLLETLLAQK